MRQRVVSSIAQAASTAISGQVEVYGYRTPNGYEERDRLVLSKGQGQVHVHMYPFGSDMFVGWQAFLNWAQWAETVPVAAEDLGAGLATKMKEDLEMWLPDSPDATKWLLEEPPNGKKMKIPEMPLPMIA